MDFESGIKIKIESTNDKNLTLFGKETLQDRYLGKNESYQHSWLKSNRVISFRIFTVPILVVILVLKRCGNITTLWYGV